MRKLILFICLLSVGCSCSTSIRTIKYENSKVKYNKENRILKKESDKFRLIKVNPKRTK